MNSVKIQVKDGEGREVNPYQIGFDTKYREFEQTAKSYPAPGIKDGTHMARLQWQWKHRKVGKTTSNEHDWITLKPEAHEDFRKQFPNQEYREIWVLSPDGETNLKTENMKIELPEWNDNKLIAKFMGVVVTKRNNEDAVFTNEDSQYPEYFRCTRHNTYHKDWNELMKVYHMILKLGYPFEITNIFAHIGRHDMGANILKHDQDGKLNTMEMAYSAILEFVKWYKETQF